MSKQPKAKKFIGVYLNEDIFRKVEILKDNLGQNVSSLVREGLCMLFERYKETLKEGEER